MGKLECWTCGSTEEVIEIEHPGYVLPEPRCCNCNEAAYMAEQERLMSGPTYRERMAHEMEQARKLK